VEDAASTSDSPLEPARHGQVEALTGCGWPADFRTIVPVRLAMLRPRVLLLALAAVLAVACGGGSKGGEPAAREGLAEAAAAAPAFPTGRAMATSDVAEPEKLGGALRTADTGRSDCRRGESRLGGARAAYAAVAEGKTTAYVRPGGRPLERFGRFNVNRYPTVFGVIGVVRAADCRPRWYRVQLPIRPNGSVGYVRARDVELVRVATRIEVDLSERRLELYRDGRLVDRLTTAIGAPSTPTPTGRYYVNQRLVPGDPTGPWGPAALGISAFSPVLRFWPQGGPIAVHGTDNPASIGHAASNGCLRVRNEDLRRLWDQVPAGTPVVIAA
jgi:hypothetical protein